MRRRRNRVGMMAPKIRKFTGFSSYLSGVNQGALQWLVRAEQPTTRRYRQSAPPPAFVAPAPH